jgi:hypothetical protein
LVPSKSGIGAIHNIDDVCRVAFFFCSAKNSLCRKRRSFSAESFFHIAVERSIWMAREITARLDGAAWNESCKFRIQSTE